MFPIVATSLAVKNQLLPNLSTNHPTIPSSHHHPTSHPIIKQRHPTHPTIQSAPSWIHPGNGSKVRRIDFRSGFPIVWIINIKRRKSIISNIDCMIKKYLHFMNQKRISLAQKRYEVHCRFVLQLRRLLGNQCMPNTVKRVLICWIR